MNSIIKTLLTQDDFLGVDKDIDFAKGLYQYPRRLKDFYNRSKRIKSWQTSDNK